MFANFDEVSRQAKRKNLFLVIYQKNVYDISKYINRNYDKLLYLQYYNGKNIDNINVPEQCMSECTDLKKVLQNYYYGRIIDKKTFQTFQDSANLGQADVQQNQSQTLSENISEQESLEIVRTSTNDTIITNGFITQINKNCRRRIKMEEKVRQIKTKLFGFENIKHRNSFQSQFSAQLSDSDNRTTATPIEINLFDDKDISEENRQKISIPIFKNKQVKFMSI